MAQFTFAIFFVIFASYSPVIDFENRCARPIFDASFRRYWEENVDKKSCRNCTLPLPCFFPINFNIEANISRPHRFFSFFFFCKRENQDMIYNTHKCAWILVLKAHTEQKIHSAIHSNNTIQHNFVSCFSFYSLCVVPHSITKSWSCHVYLDARLHQTESTPTASWKIDFIKTLWYIWNVFRILFIK